MSRAAFRRSVVCAGGPRVSLLPDVSPALLCAGACFSTTAAVGAGFVPSTKMQLRTPLRVPSPASSHSPWSSLTAQKACVFTNAKKSYARGTEAEQKAREEAAFKESQEFLRQPLEGDGHDAPRLRDLEGRLPSKKQLNEELPSAAEVEKAIKEGKMEMFTKPEKDEE